MVRVVAVNFVCRRVDEGCVGAELATRFQQIERSVGVDAEVDLRLRRCPVMRRLRGGVNDDSDVGVEFGEDLIDERLIADVDIEVLVVCDCRFEIRTTLLGRSVFTEEVLAHVVVDADDFVAATGKQTHRLGPDEPG